MMSGRAWTMAVLAVAWPLAAGAAQREVQSVAAAQPVYEAQAAEFGTRVTVHRMTPGEVWFDVTGPEVTVRRRLSAAGATTEIETAAGRLVVEMQADGWTVREGGAVQRVQPGDRAAADRLRAWAVQSEPLAVALDVLRRAARGTSAPVANLVLSTRGVLATLRGERPAAPPLRGGPAPKAPAIVRASLGQSTPGECWDIYAAEAIEIYMEYEDCVDSRNWWDVIGLGSCATIYEVQAIGAFSWWLNCTAIRG